MVVKIGRQLNTVGLEVSRRCNLSCPHCYTRSGINRPIGLSTDQLKLIVRKLGEAGVTYVSFSGGEPLLRPDLEIIMEYGRQWGIESYSTVTNGTLVTRARLEGMKKLGLFLLQISLDGVSAVDHARTRNATHKDFYKTLRAISISKSLGLEVSMGTFLNRYNAERVEEFLDLMNAMRADCLRFCTFVPEGRGRLKTIREECHLSREMAQRVVEKIYDYNMERQKGESPGYVDDCFGPTEFAPNLHCNAGKSIIYIGESGNVYPCPTLIHEPFLMGNLFERSLEELFESPNLKRLHELRKSDLIGRCSRCPNEECMGGCRGVAYAYTRKINGSFPSCLWFMRYRLSNLDNDR